MTFVVYNSWSSQDRSNSPLGYEWLDPGALPRGCQYCPLIRLASIKKGSGLTPLCKLTHIDGAVVDSCSVMAKSGTELGKPAWPFKDLYRPFVFLPALLSPRCHYLPWTRRKMLRSQRTTPMTLTLNLVRFKLVLNLVKESSLVNSRIGTLQW